MQEWLTLRDHVRALLLEGKRSNHDDFKLLFDVWGESKIREMAQEVLKDLKKEEANA